MKRLLFLFILGFVATSCEDPDLQKAKPSPELNFNPSYGYFHANGEIEEHEIYIKNPTLDDLTVSEECNWADITRIPETNKIRISVAPNITKSPRSFYFTAKHGGTIEQFKIEQRETNDIIKCNYCIIIPNSDSGIYEAVFGDFDYKNGEYYYKENNYYCRCEFRPDSWTLEKTPHGFFSPISGESYDMSFYNGSLNYEGAFIGEIIHIDSTSAYLGCSGNSYVNNIVYSNKVILL